MTIDKEAVEFQEKIAPKSWRSELQELVDNPLLRETLAEQGLEFRRIPADVPTPAPAQAEYTPDPAGAFEHGDPGDEHDSATVENTTLLIADLEGQVSATRQALAGDSILIADLEDQLAAKSEALAQSDRLIADLNAQLGEMKAIADGMIGANLDALVRIQEAEDKLDDMQAETIRAARLARHRIAFVTRGNEFLRRMLKNRQQRYKELFDEVMFYRHQGLWGRLLGKAYNE